MTEPTIQDQIDLEKRMVSFGAARYTTSVSAAVENGRAADTQYSQTLMQEFLMPVSEAIKEFTGRQGPGNQARYRSLMKVIEAEKAAYLGLRAILNHFTLEESVASLSMKIGQMVEDEAKFLKFQEQHSDYYNAIIQDFKNKGTVSYRHMHRVLTVKANQHNVEWESWTNKERAAVGTKIVDCVLGSTQLIEKREVRKPGSMHKHAVIVPTQTCMDWVKKYNNFASLLNPDRVPCIIPPDPWTSFEQGGYYSPALRSRTPLVKTRSKRHKELLQGDLSRVCTAVNALQDVAWAVNSDVLTVMKQAWEQNLTIGLPRAEPLEIPKSPAKEGQRKEDMTEDERDAFEAWKSEARTVHTMERERVSKCFQVIRVLRLATEFQQYNKFWFVHQTDFRGRMYSTVAGLSPQGADFSKALLRFHNGKPLGERGWYWFKVHGANCFGKDKLPYDDRVKWVNDNVEFIRAVADDALSNRDVWANADKPWQFLAWCYEFKRLSDDPTGLSYLPISLDGSCNGLQNFSAMLRDPVGGAATNLVPSSKPSDIYAEVAKVCTTKLRTSPIEDVKDNLKLRDMWLEYADSLGGNLPRGLAKKPVMTLPYGSTITSCRESVYKWILEEMNIPKELRWKAAVFLAPILWGSISQVVVAARTAMDWIQSSASIVSRTNKPLIWWTPVGFPVLQERFKIETFQVHTELAGHFRLRIAQDTETMDGMKQRLGSSPNFVHSMDACHLMMTLERALKQGIQAFACIHDDYGTHAADTDALHSCIREAFLELYEQNDPLFEFKNINELNSGVTLPELPPVGTLNLAEIRQSLYFFG